MEDVELGARKTCFLVGPIGDRLEPPGTEGRLRYENATQMWEHVFEPACAEVGLTPVRADKIAESGEIPEQIFTYLRDADVVIADLTGGNANVMYELGLRHTRDKITIQMGEHERLPFDVNTIRTVKFKRSEAGLIDARNALVETLRAALEGNGTPVTATRVWTALGGLDTTDVARAAALSSVSDDPADADADAEDALGRLDILVEGEDAISGAAGILSDFTAQMSDMKALSDEIAPKVAAATSFAARLTLFKQLADGLKMPAEAMEATSAEYLTTVEKIDGLMTIVIEDLISKPEQLADQDEIYAFASLVVQMSDNADVASVSFTGALGAVRSLRRLSNIIRPVARSIEHSLNTILRGNSIVTGWGARLRDLPGWLEADNPPEPGAA